MNNSWIECLPVDQVRDLILKITRAIILMIAGAGLLLFYITFYSKMNFQGGAEWMQNAYASGKVGRVVVEREKGN